MVLRGKQFLKIGKNRNLSSLSKRSVIQTPGTKIYQESPVDCSNLLRDGKICPFREIVMVKKERGQDDVARTTWINVD